MPISKPSTKEHGFTLIELLVVLSVLALLAVVAAPNIGRTPAFLVRGELVARLVDSLRKAQRQAMATSTAQHVDIVNMTPGLRWEAETGLASSMSDGPTFYPDGSALGGTVLLGQRPVVRVDWLTARIIRP
jgi:prepilin-type N-terminal cleavage/methylation domain-containing protein